MSLPPPPPLTAGEMLDNVTRTFIEIENLGEHQARYRAARALARLMYIGALEWWGMTDEGEPLFVQTPVPEQQILILPIVIREEQ